ncbi:MAG: tRNA 2-thiouridine(34) synthase MnmA [Planctomyces sp.]|nr:tRNA 2-thiouridine(34) synthase MnmA [Planctomyces sp.]MBA4120736.1 tRNA 2-thiouridine(34) synthase MnmA [Isosphaera sp.]
MPARQRVLVAMSGGVDSSVAAALLLRAGHEVVGCFMRLGSPGESLDTLVPAPNTPNAPNARPGPRATIGHQGCCSVGDAADARSVAAVLGIPLYVCNFKRDFARITDYFASEYAAGRTPNPCVRCNDWLKFGRLHDYAEQISAGAVATGHYARVEHAHDGPRLRTGLDRAKDQSYVLFGVQRQRLSRVLLPIGNMHKPDVRALARSLGLPVFDKPDSQEICFVPDQDYARFLERRDPALAQPGQILDAGGRVLGAHAGQHRFTIGQRRGLGLGNAAGDGIPLYVIAKDAARNSLTVGPAQSLAVRGCTVGEANWLVPDDHPARAPGGWTPVLIKHRSNSQPVPGALSVGSGPIPIDAPVFAQRAGWFRVRFETPQHAVTPGQALVLYDAADPTLVLGGGWIAHAQRAADHDPAHAPAAGSAAGPLTDA